MTTPTRSRLPGVCAAVLLAASPAVQADQAAHYEEPTFGSMVVDAAVARPLGLGATVVGTALWIVTLPFSALGGNMDEAATQLIVKPARFTFTRPLGEL
jgi:hypothetical protein